MRRPNWASRNDHVAEAIESRPLAVTRPVQPLGCSRRRRPACRSRAWRTAFWLAPAELAAVVAGSALKHRISWMLVLPPVEPAKPNRKFAGSAPSCRDALPRDDRLIGAAVEAVGKTQQTVLGDLQLIRKSPSPPRGSGRLRWRSGCSPGADVSVRDRRVVVQRYGVTGDLDRFACVCVVPHDAGRTGGPHRPCIHAAL